MVLSRTPRIIQMGMKNEKTRRMHKSHTFMNITKLYGRCLATGKRGGRIINTRILFIYTYTFVIYIWSYSFIDFRHSIKLIKTSTILRGISLHTRSDRTIYRSLIGQTFLDEPMNVEVSITLSYFSDSTIDYSFSFFSFLTLCSSFLFSFFSCSFVFFIAFHVFVF